jgi:hypothetical protein
MKHCTLAADRQFWMAAIEHRPAPGTLIFRISALKNHFRPAVGPALFIDLDECTLDESEVGGCELKRETDSVSRYGHNPHL